MRASRGGWDLCVGVKAEDPTIAGARSIPSFSAAAVLRFALAFQD